MEAGSMQSHEDVSDRISNLTDDIITRILSLMTMKEAATTSVLSKRWEYLWIDSLTRLIFDIDTFSSMNSDDFINMVNEVLRRFQEGMTLEEFRVRFRLSSRHESHINNWFYRALHIGTTKVEMNCLRKNHHGSYYVPIELFENHANFSALKELYLIKANVVDQVFEAILSACPSLESLIIADDYGLRGDVMCTVPHMKLKSLTMECELLESLVINAPNLHSCGYHAITKRHKNFRRPPRFVNLYISYFSLLQCLTLDTATLLEGKTIAGRFVLSFPSLKTLTLMHHYDFAYEHTAIRLLEASPILQKFELHLDGSHIIAFGALRDMIPMSQHQNLKKIIFSGFLSFPYDMDFLRFVVNHATVLECIELTTNYAKYYEIDRDGSYKQSFRNNKLIYNREEFFEDLREDLSYMFPSKISCILLDNY